MRKEIKIFLAIIATLLAITGIVFYIGNRAVVTTNNYSSSIDVAEDGTVVTDTTPPTYNWSGVLPKMWINVTEKGCANVQIADKDSNIKSANVKYEWKDYSGTQEEMISYFETAGLEDWELQQTDAAWNFIMPNPTVSGIYYCWTKLEGVDEQNNEMVEYLAFGPYYYDSMAPTVDIIPRKGEPCGTTLKVNVFDSESGLKPSNKYQYYLSTSETELVDGEWIEYIPEKESEIIVDSSVEGRRYLFIKRIQDAVGIYSESPDACVSINGEMYHKFGPYVFDGIAPIISLSKAKDENWAKAHAVTITVRDEESELADEIKLQYAWSTSKTEEPTKWDEITTESETVAKSGLIGKYYLWVKPINIKDVAGNELTKTSVFGEYYFDNEAPKIEIPVEGYKPTEIISDGLVTNYTRENNVIEPDESELPTIGSRTIEMVFKLGPSELESTLLFESGSRTTGSAYGCIHVESKYLYIWAGNIQIKQYIGIYVNQEVHLAISVNESIIKVYINGKQTNEVSILSKVDWGRNNIKISGAVSQIRLYNRALGENEILNNYAVSYPELGIIIPTNQEWKQEHNVQVNLSDEHSGLALGAQMQYGWSTSPGASPTNWNDATVQEYEEGAHKTSFIATGSGLSGKYYLWVKAIELKDTSLENGNEQITQVASQHTFWFENIGEGNIDITFSQNGNMEWAKTHSTTVTVTGAYKPSLLKYKWTRDANEPEESTFENEFTSGQEIPITDATGELYLWILAKDEDGNSTIVHSNAFYLDNEGPKLVVTPSKEEGSLSNVRINVTDTASGLKESNIYEYALINNFTGDLQTAWEYYNKSSKLEWKEYTSFESFSIGKILKGEYYLIVKGIEDNVGNANSWNAVPVYTPITLGESAENVRAFGPYNFKNTQYLSVTMTPNGNTTWNKQQEVTVLVNSTYELKEQKYLWTREQAITNDMLNKFVEMENNEKVTSPSDAEAGQDWYLWVYAEDIYGNIVLEKSSEFYIDTTVPTVEFTPNGNTTWAKTQTVEITIDDLGGSGINAESIKYLWQKESRIVPIREDITESFEDTEIVDGKIKAKVTKNTDTGDNWKLWIYVQDIAGNSRIMGSEVFEIDNTVPVAGTLTMKLENNDGNDYENNTWTTNNVYIYVNNGSDEHSGHKSTVYSVNGGTETTEPQTLTESGTYEIIVTTSDNAGNISTNSYTVKITRETALEIISNSTKMEYEAYEDFNNEGLVVSVVYDNGEKENTTDYTIINSENLTCQVTEIQIQYNNNPEIKVALTGIKVNHAEKIMEEVEPTCTEKGKTAGKYCEVCNITLEAQEEIKELGHEFNNYVSNNDATCEADGTKTAKCDRCTETKTVTDEGSKLQHNYETEVTKATCTEGGYTTYTCTKCNDTYKADKTEALGHNFEKEVIAPECTKGGYTIYRCTRCDENYNAEYTSALGHSFTNYVSNNNATCEADGTKTSKCDRCEQTKTVLDEGSKKIHEYKDGECIYCKKEEPKIKITSQIYMINDLYISKLQPKTTVKVFKSNIETNATEIKIYNKNGEVLEENDIIATGMQLELKLGELTRRFEIVVKGDLYSDGKADILDMIIINYARLKKETLTGAKFIAADIMEDGKITIDDLVKINKFRLRKISEI